MTEYHAKFTPARPGNLVTIPDNAICVEWTTHGGMTGVRWLEPTTDVEINAVGGE